MKTSRLLLLSLFSVLLVSRGLAQFDDDDDDYADSRDPVTAVPDGNQNVWIAGVGNDDDPTTDTTQHPFVDLSGSITDEPTPAPAVQEETTEATAEETIPVDAAAVQEQTTEAPIDIPTAAPAVQEETTPADAPAVPDVTDAPTDAPAPAVQEETTEATAEETTPVDAAAVPEETTEAPAPAVQATGEETTPDSAPAVPDVTDAPTDAPTPAPAVQATAEETTPVDAPAVPEETTVDPYENNGGKGTGNGGTPDSGSPIETTEASADVTTPDAAPVATNVDTTENPLVVILSGSDGTTTEDPFGFNGADGSGKGGSPNAGSVDTTTVDPSSFNGGFAGFNPNKKPTWTIDEIDPKVLASLSDRNLKLDRVPGYLKDGRRTDEMLDDEWMMSDFSNGEFPQREVNSKEGQYVLSAVQTKGNNVVYDPFTIGQVLGYLYEYNEFAGQKPAGGWTLEMFGKQLPTWIRKKREAKTRRATLIFKKKPEVIAKEEEAYWKQFMSSI